MTPQEQRQAAPYIVAATLAAWLQAGAWVALLVLTLWHGPGGAVGGLGLVWIARLAKPPLPPDLAAKVQKPPP
jgi:hypothetical protein